MGSLLEKDDVMEQDKLGQILLCIVACNRVTGSKLIELLLDNTIYVKIQDKNGRTALHNAALFGYSGIVEPCWEEVRMP